MENIDSIYSEIVDLITFEAFQKGEKFKKIHILVIDDSATMRKNFIRKLESKKIFEVVEARNGIEGLYMLGKYRESIKIIFFDIWMPIMDGPEFFIKGLKAGLLEGIPLIATVSAINKKLLIELIRRGVYSYLLYPFSEEELMSMLRDAFTKKVRGIKDLIDQITKINTSGRNTMEYSNFSCFRLLEEKIEYEDEKEINSDFEENSNITRNINADDNQENFERQNCKIKNDFNETLNSAETGKKITERTLTELKRDRTSENNPKLFYLNESLKKNLILYLITYLQERNYNFDYYEDFVDFFEKSGDLDKKSKDVITEFDEKGILAVYNSDKELFTELYQILSECKLEKKELNSVIEYKDGIYYYIIAYWKFFLKEKIKLSLHAEYTELRNLLNQGSVDVNKKNKYFEQLINKWKTKISAGSLSLQSLKSSGDKIIHEAAALRK
ncbi:response regulator [Candidatus Dependentiae bacterium]|nr:response regulator [Candidatus Dependentiae bacterium]